jgi:hypothetical protein
MTNLTQNHRSCPDRRRSRTDREVTSREGEENEHGQPPTGDRKPTVRFSGRAFSAERIFVMFRLVAPVFGASIKPRRKAVRSERGLRCRPPRRPAVPSKHRSLPLNGFAGRPGCSVHRTEAPPRYRQLHGPVAPRLRTRSFLPLSWRSRHSAFPADKSSTTLSRCRLTLLLRERSQCEMIARMQADGLIDRLEVALNRLELLLDLSEAIFWLGHDVCRLGQKAHQRLLNDHRAIDAPLVRGRFELISAMCAWAKSEFALECRLTSTNGDGTAGSIQA